MAAFRYRQKFLDPAETMIHDAVQNDRYRADDYQLSFNNGSHLSYANLISSNKDTNFDTYVTGLNAKFNDDRYTDYDTRMAILSLKFLDNTTKLKESDDWEIKKVDDKVMRETQGEMTDYEWTKYLIDQRIAYNDYLVEADLKEQEKKRKWVLTTAATILELPVRVIEGALSASANILDWVIAPFYAVGKTTFGDGNWDDNFVNYFGSKASLTGLEQKELRNNLNAFAKEYSFTMTADGQFTAIAGTIAQVATGIGEMLPIILLQLAAPGTGIGLMGAKSMSAGLAQQNMNPATSSASSWLKLGNAYAKSMVDVALTIAMSKWFGGTNLDKMMYGIESGISQSVMNVTADTTRQAIINQLTKEGAMMIAKDAFKQGARAMLSSTMHQIIDGASSLIKSGYKGDISFNDIIQAGLMAGLTSLAMSSISLVPKGTVKVRDQQTGRIEKIDTNMNRLASHSYNRMVQSVINMQPRNLQEAELQAKTMLMTQTIYSAFPPEQVAKAQVLFQRLIEQEQTIMNVKDAMKSQTDKGTLYVNNEQIDALFREATGLSAKEVKSVHEATYQQYNAYVSEAITNMIRNANISVRVPTDGNLSTTIRQATEKVSQKLLTNGMIEIKEVVTQESLLQTQKSQSLTKIESKMLDLAKSSRSEIFIQTSGSGIVETSSDIGNITFVGTEWLENYKTNEMYKTLYEDKVLEKLLDGLTNIDLDARLGMELRDTFRKITNNPNADIEETIMNVLFNPIVFEKMLSQYDGKDALSPFHKFLTSLPGTIEILVKAKEVTPERAIALRNVLRTIKTTMAPAVIRAAVNFQLDYTAPHIAHLLSSQDKQMINEKQLQIRHGKATQGLEVKLANMNTGEKETSLARQLFQKQFGITLEDAWNDGYRDVKIRQFIIDNYGDYYEYAWRHYTATNFYKITDGSYQLNLSKDGLNILSTMTADKVMGPKALDKNGQFTEKSNDKFRTALTAGKLSLGDYIDIPAFKGVQLIPTGNTVSMYNDIEDTVGISIWSQTPLYDFIREVNQVMLSKNIDADIVIKSQDIEPETFKPANTLLGHLINIQESDEAFVTNLKTATASIQIEDPVTINQVLQFILMKELDEYTAARITINDIVNRPFELLSPEIKNQLDITDLSWQNIYNVINNWFKDNKPGYRLDMKRYQGDYRIPEITLTSDKPFTRLLQDKFAKQITDVKGKNLINDLKKELGDKGEMLIPVTRFFDATEMNLLNVPSRMQILVKSNNDEASYEAQIHRTDNIGRISLGIQGIKSNGRFLDEILHEMIHAWQDYNKIVMGGHIDFTLTEKQIADVKAHNELDFKNEPKTNWHSIARKVLYISSNEARAYGLDNRMVPSHYYINNGKFNILTSWGELYHNIPMKAVSKLRTKGDIKDATKAGIKKPSLPSVDTRRFTKARAEGNNLMNYYKSTGSNEMDPEVQRFIIGSTGNEEKLPKELAWTIQNGKPISYQRLMEYFREIPDMNRFTFDLFNKSFWQNPVIKSFDDLDALVNNDIVWQWAAVKVLKSLGAADDMLLRNMTVEQFNNFLSDKKIDEFKSLLSENERTMIDKQMTKFNEYYDFTRAKGDKKFVASLNTKTTEYARVLAMEYFDGTLAGAFKVANKIRDLVRDFQETTNKGMKLNKFFKKDDGSLDMELGDETTVLDVLDKSKTEAGMTDALIRESILDLYDRETSGFKEITIAEKMTAIVNHQVEKYKKMPDALEKRDIKVPVYDDFGNIADYEIETVKMWEAKELALQKLLDTKSDAEIDKMYEKVRDEKSTGLEARNILKTTVPDTRAVITGNIKRDGIAIIKFIKELGMKFEQLPKEIQDMYSEQKNTYRIKSSVYSVGKGAIKGKGSVSHDVTQILDNAKLLRTVKNNLKSERTKLTKQNTKIEGLEKRLVKKVAEIEKLKTQPITKEKTVIKEVVIKEFVDKDITIITNGVMPDILIDIYNKAAVNTEDKGVSKTKFGNLEGEEYIRARLEVFARVTESDFAKLERQDIINIKDFLRKGYMVSGDLQSDSLFKAYDVYTLAILTDLANRNAFGWNLSEAERNDLRDLYGKYTHLGARVMGAVSAVQRIVDPVKHIIENNFMRKFEMSREDVEPLVEKFEKFTNAKAGKEQQKLGEEFIGEMMKLEEKIIEQSKRVGDKKNWYEQLKSARYTFGMLFTITAPIRNIVNNFVITGLYGSSSKIGQWVFGLTGKDNYREGQWNLAGTKTSTEVKTFVDNNVKPFFNWLYAETSKFDDYHKRGSYKEGEPNSKEKDQFINMVVSKLESEYAATHRFNRDVFNRWSSIVSWALSDKRFVEHHAMGIIGKILTIESEAGRVKLEDGVTKDVLNLLSEAVLKAGMDFMHKRGPFMDAIAAMKRAGTIGKVTAEVIEWMEPFLNTSMNYFGLAMRASPLGLIRAIYRSATLEKQIRRQEERRQEGNRTSDSRFVEDDIRRDVGIGIIGTVFWLLGSVLALLGIIKVDDDTDGKVKFYIGDLKLDISNLTGSSSILAGAALIGGIKNKDKNFDAIFNDVANALLNGFVVSDLASRHKYDKSVSQWILTDTESVMKSFIPQVWQLFVRLTNDKKIRYTSGVQGMLERWANSFIPTQPFGNRIINPYNGEEITRHSIPILFEFLNILPVKFSSHKVSEQERLAMAYDIKKGELTGKLTINGEEYILNKRTVNKKYGELNEKSLANLESSKTKYKVQMSDGTYKELTWSQMSDVQRGRVIDRTMNDNANYAKIYAWTQSGNKYYASADEYKVLVSLGIKTNVYKETTKYRGFIS